jgi:RNA polymerase sigma factor (sigma-70 family)
MENQNLLRKLAWNYAKKSRLEFDDLLQEANLAYLEAIRTHESEKGMLSTHVWHCVHNHLLNYITKESTRTFEKIDEIDIPEASSENIFEKLTQEAAEVVKIIFDAPWELIGIIGGNDNPAKKSKTEAKNRILEMLIERHWEEKKIESAFSCLQSVYN